MIGAGLTSRIVDCYAAVICVWQPGDRIYLMGFSRGAYTVRCVAHVLELAGIPTKVNGGPLSLEPTALRAVAKAGVKTMYTLGLPVSNLDKRIRAIEAFRKKYDCVLCKRSS
jgi:type VI secretion system (T6SS) phospholipase Tle1-like effector